MATAKTARIPHNHNCRGLLCQGVCKMASNKCVRCEESQDGHIIVVADGLIHFACLYQGESFEELN